MKTCTGCKLELADSFFGKRSRNVNGLQSKCKKCFNEISRRYNASKSDSGWKYGRNSWYKRKYGITYQDKVDMLNGQDGACAICKKDMNLDNKCHVDHDHVTGIVRGLLCSKCNVGLHYIENQQFIQNAKEYLEK